MTSRACYATVIVKLMMVGTVGAKTDNRFPPQRFTGHLLHILYGVARTKRKERSKLLPNVTRQPLNDPFDLLRVVRHVATSQNIV